MHGYKIHHNLTIDKSVRDTLSYQKYCKNTLDFIMGLSYKASKLDILII